MIGYPSRSDDVENQGDGAVRKASDPSVKPKFTNVEYTPKSTGTPNMRRRQSVVDDINQGVPRAMTRLNFLYVYE